MKYRVDNYSWVAATGAITFTDLTTVNLGGVLVITNVTDNIIIYNFAVAGLGGTVGTNVLTVAYDTSGMADADKLQIWYDDGIHHDDADVNAPPSKIGTVAVDFAPDSEGEQGPTAVAAGDLVECTADRKGMQPERVLSKYELLTGLDLTYDDAPTTATSAAVDCYRYRKCTLQFDLAMANAPTSIRFTILVSSDGTNYAELTNGPLAALIYDDLTVGVGGITQAITFDIACQKIKIKVTATGTDASKTFTVDNCALFLRN